MAVLVIDSGPEEGLSYELGENDAAVIIGRKSICDIRLTDTMVSGQHCRFRVLGTQFFIEDLGSTNGLWKDGQQINDSEVFIGDIFRVGDTHISLISESEFEEEEEDEESGMKIPGFEIIEQIGIGGMGIVYQARQVSLDRIVALKLLSKRYTKNKNLVERFISEARAAGKLIHGNVVQVHDVGEYEGIYYICMEYIDGGNLTDMLRERETIDERTVVEIATDVAKGLEYAEMQGIVHCDIKPDNIMLTLSGVAKIADLGIARSLSEQQAGKLKEVMGSPHYMPPEQAQGKPLDCRTDLYALGCTIYRMLAGKPPFTGTNSQEVMKKQVYETPVDIQEAAPRVSEKMAALVMRLIEKKPENRFANAADLISALETLGGGNSSVSNRQAKRVATPPKINQAPKAKPKVKASQRLAKPKPGRKAKVRSGGGRGRGKKSDDTPMIIGGVVGVVILCALFMFFAIGGRADEGAKALRLAQKLEGQGKLVEALRVAEKGDSADISVRRKLKALEKTLRTRVFEIENRKNFIAAWNLYQSMASRGDDKSDLIKKLKSMHNLFKRTPEFKRQIEDELEKLERGGN